MVSELGGETPRQPQGNINLTQSGWCEKKKWYLVQMHPLKFVDVGDGQFTNQRRVALPGGEWAPDPRKYQRLTPGPLPTWTQTGSATWRPRK